MQGERIDLVAGARIDFGHHRIVAGDEAVRMAGEPLDGAPALRHVPDIVEDGKRTPLVQVGIIVRGVRGQHHRPALRLDPHHLQTIGVTADVVQGGRPHRYRNGR